MLEPDANRPGRAEAASGRVYKRGLHKAFGFYAFGLVLFVLGLALLEQLACRRAASA